MAHRFCCNVLQSSVVRSLFDSCPLSVWSAFNSLCSRNLVTLVFVRDKVKICWCSVGDRKARCRSYMVPVSARGDLGLLHVWVLQKVYGVGQ